MKQNELSILEKQKAALDETVKQLRRLLEGKEGEMSALLAEKQQVEVSFQKVQRELASLHDKANQNEELIIKQSIRIKETESVSGKVSVQMGQSMHSFEAERQDLLRQV